MPTSKKERLTWFGEFYRDLNARIPESRQPFELYADCRGRQYLKSCVPDFLPPRNLIAAELALTQEGQ